VRLRYRTSQFWKALYARPTQEQLTKASQVLNPELMRLFQGMQPSEQAHSLEIFHTLVENGESNNDLLTAALLHDVGKSRYPLKVWERIIIVIGKALLPEIAREWGKSTPRGWRRPFVVSEQHALWGAQMVEKAGASSITIELIRRHQDQTPINSLANSNRTEDILLIRLRLLDNRN